MKRSAAWPTAPDSADVYADEADHRSGYDDYRERVEPALPKAEYLPLETDFRARIRDIFAGRDQADAALVSSAQQLGLTQSRRNASRRNQPGPSAVPNLSMIARITTDLCPAAGGESADRFLGPIADALDLRNPDHRHAAQVALAALCFSVTDGTLNPNRSGPDPGLTPFEL
ncbi:MAG: hypothetical protein GWP91_01135, partial [Rhodobacterales bacterium]|nr:hypothetical protein [Rhodobacterales bacterium]